VVPPRGVAVRVARLAHLPALGRSAAEVVRVHEARVEVAVDAVTRVVARVKVLALLLARGVPAALLDAQLREGILALPGVELASRAVLEAGVGVAGDGRGRGGGTGGRGR